MEGKSVAVLDANVLYGVFLTDVFLRFAARRFYIPIWSEKIQDEWSSNLKLKSDIGDNAIDYRRQKMDEKFPQALAAYNVDRLADPIYDDEKTLGWPTIPPLPDPRDEHVLERAIEADADYIVTFNLKDFPIKVLKHYGKEPIHPDKFILSLIAANEHGALEVFAHHRSILKKPSLSEDSYLQKLKHNNLPQTAAWLARQAF